MLSSRLFASSLFLLVVGTSLQAGTILTEGFDSVSSLTGSGWVLVNNSTTGGLTGWFQGDAGIFTSQAGAGDSYVAANFNNAPFSGGDISNWLISPVLSLQYDLQIVFFTRTEAIPAEADRLDVLLSTSGSSSNVGSTTTSVGDFTTALLTINPTLDLAGYPTSWTQYTINLAGTGVASTGRIALRYDVTDTTANADYIGIDTLSVNQTVPEPATWGLIAFGLGVTSFGGRLRRSRKQA